MFKNNFVATIMCGDKFLKEQEGHTVLLPFLSEYSIFLWNKNSKRASVSIEIDGQDITSSNPLILNANEQFTLERFIEKNVNKSRKFRFIEMTKNIEDYRGIKPSDSLIKISFKYENDKIPNPYQDIKITPLTMPKNPHHYQTLNGPTCFSTLNGFGKQVDYLLRRDTLDQSLQSPQVVSNSIAIPSFGDFIPDIGKTTLGDSLKRVEKSMLGFDFVEKKQDENPKQGITVKGSESTQKIKPSFPILNLDHSSETVIIFQLKGTTAENDNITQPITKTSTKTCSSCGKKWSFDFSYCPGDATFLEAL